MSYILGIKRLSGGNEVRNYEIYPKWSKSPHFTVLK